MDDELGVDDAGVFLPLRNPLTVSASRVNTPFLGDVVLLEEVFGVALLPSSVTSPVELLEQVAVEREFAARLLIDAVTPTGGGYATPLGNTLLATSVPFGWRDEAVVRETIRYEHNRFVAIAERSVVVGYEASIGAAEIVPEP